MPLLILALHAVHRLIHLHPFVGLRLLRALVLVCWLLHHFPVVGAFQLFKSAPSRARGRIVIMPPRCCHRVPDEFKPSYASVLVYGSDPIKLEQAVRKAETEQRITSCFTAWCPTCAGPYLLTTDMDAFPSPSAHHTHQLVLLSVLRESGALVPAEAV